VNVSVEKPKYIQRDADHKNRIDMPRFAADLTKALIAACGLTRVAEADCPIKLLPPGEYPKQQQTIQVGRDVLELYSNEWKQRVTASITAPDVAWGDWSSYAQDQKAESASVNPDGRSIDAIAKDIKKRVIDANQSAMAARRKYAKQQQDNRAGLAAKAQALGAACPTLSIKVDEREQVATIWNRGSAYLDARMSPTGCVSIQRIGGVSEETFIKIVALLEANKEPE